MLRYTGKTEVLNLDLALFDVDEMERREHEKNQRDRLKKHKNPNATASRRGNWFLLTLLAACILAFLFIGISGKIELERVFDESNAVAFEMDRAAKENLRLRAELEAKATPAKIEEYAQENGLVKEQFAAQVVIVSANVEKSTEVVEPNNNLLNKFKKWARGELEFFGVG